ncbi:MAG: ATP cone domain-containing protein, partial [Raoultibacter sp.]
MYQVKKRDGKISEFDIAKIAGAIAKAFDAQEKQYHPSTIDLLALNVTAHFEGK